MVPASVIVTTQVKQMTRPIISKGVIGSPNMILANRDAQKPLV